MTRATCAANITAGPDAVGVSRVTAVVNVDCIPRFVDNSATIPVAIIEISVVISHLRAAKPIDRHTHSINRGIAVAIIASIHCGRRGNGPEPTGKGGNLGMASGSSSLYERVVIGDVSRRGITLG